MATLQELKDSRQSAYQVCEGILADAKANSNDILSEEQRTAYDLSMTSFDDFDVQVKAAEVDANRKAALAAKMPAIPPRQTMPDPIVPDGGDGYTVGDNSTLAIKDKKFECLGDQLQAIAQQGITGNHNNEMLTWEQLTPATGSAQAGIPSDGGYLIQKDFLTDLSNAMSEQSSLPAVRTIPIGPNSDGLKLSVVNETSRATGSRWGGVQVYWGAEADAATAKKPSFRVMELELKELIGLAYVTNRLLNDASALEAVFLQAFSEEMTFMKEDARINGTGAGQPKGILSTTGASATIEVVAEVGQGAATIVYENIQKMWARMWARSRSKAVWLINQDVEPELNNMILDAGVGGHPVYLPPGGLSVAPYGTLMGRPVIPVEYCQTVGTAGDIILWDPTQYVEIVKGGMQADQSIHVRFTTNENTFRFITRIDGQPLWNSALTPFKGSNTLSPQVTLATRS